MSDKPKRERRWWPWVVLKLRLQRLLPAIHGLVFAASGLWAIAIVIYRGSSPLLPIERTLVCVLGFCGVIFGLIVFRVSR